MRTSTLTTTAATLTVAENAGPTTIGIRAPTDTLYAASRLKIKITALPSDGRVFLADGVTQVTLGEQLTVAQLTGLEFKPTVGLFGRTSTLTYSVTDPLGTTATGSASLTIAPDALPPVTTAAALSVADNAGPTKIGIAAPTDPNYAAAQLTVTVTALPSDGAVLLADGATAVTLGEKLTVSQLTGLEFKPLATAAGQTSTFAYTVSDPSGLTATGKATLAVTGAVLTVGPGKEFATLAAAVAASHDGDLIEVQAGTYVNDFATITTDITIEGVGGTADFICTEQIPNGKAILVTDANVTIANLAFSGARVSDANGAGIRYETGNLTLNDDYFFNNQEGLLAADNPAGSITINNSEFASNGVTNPTSVGYGNTHNLDVGNIATLTISGSYFHDARNGSEIKSRANSTAIQTSRIDDYQGTAAYSIDLPNGGAATITGNVIEQGANSGNPLLISFGENGTPLATTALAINGNTFVNDLQSTASLAVGNDTATTAQLGNNQFYGLAAGQVVSGANTQTGDTFLTTRPTLDATDPWTNGALPVTTPARLTVAENSAATPIAIKSPTDAAYAASQLTAVVTCLPTDGTVLLPDNVTAVALGQKLTVAQLTGLDFKPTAGLYGSSSMFAYEIVDPVGRPAMGAATLTIASQPPPVTVAASLTVFATAGATPIGIAAPSDPNYTAGQLTVNVTALPNDGTVLLSDGVTPVSIGQQLTVAQLTGLEFKPLASAAGQTSTFGYTVTDPASLSAAGTVTLGVAAAASPDDSTLLPGTGGSLTTAAGVWTFSTATSSAGNLILLNGASAANGAGIELEVAEQGNMFATTAFGDWWEWVNGGWTPSTAPTTQGTVTQPTVASGVDIAPIPVQPSQAGDIVGLRLQNTGTTAESAGFVTFAEVFKTGTVKPTDTLVARINGVIYAVQMDVKSTNADGSVRQALLTLDAPQIAAGGSLDVMLAKGSATAPTATAPTAAALISGGYNLAVSFTFHNPNGTTTAASASAATALQAALSAGTVKQWMAGPGVNQYDVTTTVDGGKLKLEFDIRAYADGTTTTDVIFDNSWMFSSGKTDLNYDVKISQGGQQVFAASGVPQYLYTTWDHQVASTGRISPNVQYDLGYLEAANAIPNYDTSLGVSDAAIQNNLSLLTPGNTGPMGSALVDTYMPDTGGRDDLGPEPAWMAEWLMAQNPAASQVMLANAAAGGTVPWHYTDESTGTQINVQTYPNFWDDYRGTLVPTNGWPDSNPADQWTLDAAHMPDLNYVPALISGSRYQLEQVQAEANYALSFGDPNYTGTLIDGKYPAGITLDGYLELRAEAWCFREIADAAYLTPDSDPLKNYFVSALQSNMQALVQQYIVDNINGKYGAIRGFIDAGAGQATMQTPPWTDGYFVTAMAQIAGMGIPQASAQAVQILNYMDNWVAGLFTNANKGYNPLNATAYYLEVADPTTNVPYTTWSQLYNANVQLGNIPANPTALYEYTTDVQGGYAAINLATLADMITYVHSPRDFQAYGWLASQMAKEFAQAGIDETAAYQNNPDWAIMPKLPDGVYLSRSQMQIDTSSNNVVLTAANGDSLLSVTGGGTDTLNAGTSASNLLYGGSGADTFNDGPGNNYMFGGSGTNTFNDGAGNDYYQGAGKQNVYWFGVNNSGHDQIAKFNPSTDTLKVAANLDGDGITSASQLIAGATISGGNTVLHLGAANDITLLGVSSPTALGASLLVS